MTSKEKSLEEEIESRIKTMEAEGYDYGPKINKNDVIAMIIVGIVSILGMIWGVM